MSKATSPSAYAIPRAISMLAGEIRRLSCLEAWRFCIRPKPKAFNPSANLLTSAAPKAEILRQTLITNTKKPARRINLLILTNGFRRVFKP